MARHVFCAPCGADGLGSAPFSRGSGDSAERTVWGTLRTRQMKQGRYVNKGISKIVIGKKADGTAKTEEVVTIEETERMADAPHADLECARCGGLLLPGETACLYSLGDEPAWESRYLEGADGG